MKKIRLLLTLFIVSLCSWQSAWATEYVAPEWSEYPMEFNTMWEEYAYFFRSPEITQGQTSMSATVSVDSEATLIFEYGTTGSWVSSQGDLRVYLDGVLTETVNSVEYNHNCRYFVEMGPGTHTISWTYERNNATSSSIGIANIGVMATPQISVNLLEPGSLGTEILYQVDHVKKVRNLKITGSMNDDDWAKIQMMPDLFKIDLSGTNIKSIASKCFYNSGNNPYSFLHFVRLPETVETIGYQAFAYSNVDDINIPSSLKTLGSEAFRLSKIREAMLPNTMTTIEYGAFLDCRFLRKANFPESINLMPNRTFENCTQLNDLTLHEGLTEIETFALRNMPMIKKIPSTVITIGEGAFHNCWGVDSIFIPNSCTYIGDDAFTSNQARYIEFPVIYSAVEGRTILDNTSYLETIVIKSPTVLTGRSYTNIVPSWRKEAITLKVPDYLVTSYKLDSYWYEFGNIEGFSTANVKDWIISRPLTLNNSRFEGTPNITLQGKGALKINGEAPMTIDNFSSQWDIDGSGDNAWKAQILSNCDNITIEGDCKVGFGMNAKKWYFLSLPFDTRISDITVSGNAKYAIRYYDGAVRAENGTGGSWKNFEASDVIPAGKGFIVQANAWTWMFFKSVENGTKQNIVGNTEFVTSLAANNSDITANKGWNLVGNPWNCYYNIHKVNFTAPITIWNGSTYVAYSILDDDYAIRPNEAFFVQCPNEEYNTIGFPIQGRQLTSVIESQNAARQQMPQAKSRKVVNLTVSNGETEDMTRVVLNDGASMAYEVNCDASKFMSMDGSVPQIYTLDADGTQYAINERPVGEGIIALGFYAGVAGDYTLSLSRCDAEKVFLTDYLTGTTTELTDAPYSFSAGAGTDNTRFTLSFVSGETTGIKEIGKVVQIEQTEVYSTDGKFLGTDASRLGSGIYIVRQGKKVSKVVVR